MFASHNPRIPRLSPVHACGVRTYGVLAMLVGLPAMLSLAGCGGGPARDAKWPEPVPVSGTVRYEGEPLADAQITFSPEGTGYLATGTSDAEGRYTLMTRFSRSFEEEGVVPGKYKVLVGKFLPESEWKLPEKTGDEVADMEAMYAIKDPNAFSAIPVDYNDITKTPLGVEIGPEGAPEVPLDIVDVN